VSTARWNLKEAGGTNLDESGFNNVATPSWICGVDITLDQGPDLISWWGRGFAQL